MQATLPVILGILLWCSRKHQKICIWMLLPWHPHFFWSNQLVMSCGHPEYLNKQLGLFLACIVIWSGALSFVHLYLQSFIAQGLGADISCLLDSTLTGLGANNSCLLHSISTSHDSQIQVHTSNFLYCFDCRSWFIFRGTCWHCCASFNNCVCWTFSLAYHFMWKGPILVMKLTGSDRQVADCNEMVEDVHEIIKRYVCAYFHMLIAQNIKPL